MAKNNTQAVKRNMTSIQWLSENGHEDVVEKIRNLELAWAEAGRRTRRCWKQVLMGTSTGQPVKLSLNGRGSDSIEFPVLASNKSFVNKVWGGPEGVPDHLQHRAPKKRGKKEEDGAEKAPKKPRVKKDKAEKAEKPPKAPKAPKAEKAPKAPKEPKAPKAEKAPKAPKAEKAPKAPKAEKTEKAEKPEKVKKDASSSGRVKTVDEAKEKKDAVKDKVKAAVKGRKSKDKEDQPSVGSILTKEWRHEKDIAKEAGATVRSVKHDLQFLEQRGFVVGQNSKDGGMEWRKL